MRSFRGPGTMLAATAKKKPRLQELIDKVTDMSFDEIEALQEKKWVIQGLMELKFKEMEKVTLSNAEIIADMMTVDPTTVVEPLGDVYFMNGDTVWLGMGHSGDFKVEIKYGDLLWVNPKTNELSYDHMRTVLTVQQAQGLVPMLKYHTGDVTYLEYRRMVADKYNNDFPNAPVLIDQTGTGGTGMVGARVGGQMVFGYNPT